MAKKRSRNNRPRNTKNYNLLDENDDISILRKLIQEEPEVSPVIIYEILKDYIRLTSDGKIMFKSAAKSLMSRDKVLLVLIAKKALNLLKMAEEEGMTPTEIATILDAKGGSVRAILSQLKKKGFVYSPRRGVWKVNWSKIDEIREELGVGSRGNTHTE